MNRRSMIAVDRLVQSTSGARHADIELSVVGALYRSEQHLDEFVQRTVVAARQLTTSFEIILVNDCSPDGSLQHALALQQQHPEIRIVDLAKNFGHHKAMMTGLCFARGERVYLIDVDLEEDPEWLQPFWRKMDDGLQDVIYGVQHQRKGSLIERVFGSLFYWVVNLSGEEVFQTNSVTARLMSRRYVAVLTAFQEREFAIGDLWVRAGFAQAPYLVEKKSRGGSSYTLVRRLRNAVLGIVSTSTLPLKLIFAFGLLVSVISSIYIAYLLGTYFVTGHVAPGWTSLILSVWLLGGATLMSLGIIGIYLSRIFYETKRRPYVVIRDVHDLAGNTIPTHPLDAAGGYGLPGPGSRQSRDLERT
jgi:putative glycosyltransferase